MNRKSIDWKLFDSVVMHVREYFVFEYHAGTREMIYRYVTSKIGDVDPIVVSAALKILRESNVIVYDKRVWWFLSDK
jgi:hypothetical protein